ncbi:MAG: SDR family oxidoreductase [Janthinobacterium lividum]
MMRRVVVTGASSGIGAAIADRLLAQGWAVTGISRTPPAPGIDHLALNLASVTAAELREALADLPVQALVHAAGILRVAPLGSLEQGDGAAMWRLHVDCAAMLADILLPAMTTGGRVVLIGSRTATGAAGRSQYAASKAALVGLARSWAAEVASRGITVNVVAPGATETPMLKDPARGSVAPRMPPIGRFVQPGEVAALVSFLLGDEAAAITGQQIVVCGGASL